MINNVEGCVPMKNPKYHDSLMDISSLICNTLDGSKCSELHGVFSAESGGVNIGVMPYSYSVSGSGFVSGPGTDYSVESKLAQYYALCSLPRAPPSSLLVSDSANYYYKVAVSHGVKMNGRAVKDACDSAGMTTVCYHFMINNVEGCVPMKNPKYHDSLMDISSLICNTLDGSKCSELHGVFSAESGGVNIGVMPYSYSVSGSGFVSGPGTDYSVESKLAQYYALCSLPRDGCYCGLANRPRDKRSLTQRIVGGEDTKINEYPWQVRIYSSKWYHKKKKTCEKGTSRCGGSVIGEQCGLTPADVEVHLGKHHSTDKNEAGLIIMDGVAKISRHKKYDYKSRKTRYDFALLKLTKKINFGLHPHIRPICLPVDDSNDYSGYTATATGWGLTSWKGDRPTHLQEVDLTVGTQTECRDMWGTQHIEQLLCAKGFGGKGHCSGDSGGPLITKEVGDSGTVPGQNYELIGVTSFTKTGTCKDHFQAFARVTAQWEWIREETKDSWRTCPRI